MPGSGTIGRNGGGADGGSGGTTNGFGVGSCAKTLSELKTTAYPAIMARNNRPTNRILIAILLAKTARKPKVGRRALRLPAGLSKDFAGMMGARLCEMK